MAKSIDYNKGDTLPDFWLDRLQEVMARAAFGLKLEHATTTSLRIPAGTDNDQTGIFISGVWRYITTAVTASHPGGAAGLYDVWVTAADNNFSGLSPNIDLTNYSFQLTIKTVGYSWTGGDPPKRRKIGQVYWDGSVIVDVRQSVERISWAWKGTLATRPAAAAENEGLLYFASNDNGGTLYRSTGSVWEKVAAAISDALIPGPHAASHLGGGTDSIAWGTVIAAGLLASRVAAAVANNGYLYLATDVNGGTLYRSNGTTWVQVALGVTERGPIAQSILLFGLAANLPAPTAANRYFYYNATDTGFLYQNQSGATWATILDGSRLPTSGEKAALVGTFGAPGSGNKYVTDSDPRVGAAGGTAGGDLSGSYPNPTVVRASAALALPGDITPAGLTADVNDYNPAGLPTATVLRLSSNASWTITGLAGGTDGRLILIHNIGTFPVVLAHENAGSAAANRFSLPSAQDSPIGGGETALIQYDPVATRWRLMSRTAPAVFTGAAVYSQANQSIGQHATVVIAFGGEDLDTSAFHSAGSSRLAVPTGLDGMYEVDAFGAFTGGDTTIMIRKNGSIIMASGGDGHTDGAPTGVPELSSTARCPFIQMVAGDYVEAVAFNGSGSTNAIAQARAGGHPASGCMLTMRKIG